MYKLLILKFIFSSVHSIGKAKGKKAAIFGQLKVIISDDGIHLEI